jgi:hypothetical protein
VAARAQVDERAPRTSWGFLTNHGNVLLCIVDDPEIRLRDVAARVGITERATQSIVADLVEAGYVTRTRVGRRNRYAVHLDRPLRSPAGPERSVGAMVAGVRARSSTSGSGAASTSGTSSSPRRRLAG